MEIEKKFLIEMEPEALEQKILSRALRGYRIEQAYLWGKPVIRVRKMQELSAPFSCRYILTVKGKGAIAHEELELEIEAEEYQGLLSKKEGRMVVKDRFEIPLEEGLLAEVDLFRGDHEGLRIVEVEFESLSQCEAFVPPAWFGKDVSLDSRYHNSYLAMSNANRNAIDDVNRDANRNANGKR